MSRMVKSTPILQILTIVFLTIGFQFPISGLALPNQNFQERPLIVQFNKSSDKDERYDISAETRAQFRQNSLHLKVTTPGTPVDEEFLTASIHGIRIEDVDKGVGYDSDDKGISTILAGATASIRLYGDRFTESTVIRFVTEQSERGSDCDDLPSTRQFTLVGRDLTQYSALSSIQLRPLNGDEEAFYICARQEHTNMSWIHQGSESWIQIKTYEKMLPLWAQIVIILVLLALSGLFSGLNLGLMSLDRTEMKIIAATGSEKERRYAKAIQPLRDNGNYLLCTLLLGNVLVNSTLTILLDDLSSGLIAVIASTVSIVIFGEIVPQAICSRHGLAVGANTVWLTKFFMLLTFPASYPISFILNKILGKEIGNVYNRERLKELIRVTHDYNDLEKDEVNIIAGALELKQKTVAEVMTKLDKIFMLPTDAVLDFDTVSEIMSQGYSRVPIYDGTRNNLISVLYTKDLAFIDPDDKMPLRSICDFYSTPIMYVYETTTLDILFRDFKSGNKGHMAFAQRVTEGEKGSDNFYEITGVVTMEDVIEALIQSEIHDETDVYDSIRRRRSRAQLSMALTPSPGSGMRWGCDNVHISPQLVLAAFQYLSTSIDEFSNAMISKSILQRLLYQNLFFQIKVKSRDYLQHGDKAAIYEMGKPADYFVLILEGRVQVEMGKENLLFESGPFSFFGLPLLGQSPGIGETPAKTGSKTVESVLGSTFVPDYTVRPVVDTTFLKISKSMYLAAKQATVVEKTLAVSGDGDHFQNQIDQMLFSEGENASNRNFLRRKSSGKSPSPGDPSYLVSNQNTFPRGAGTTEKRRNSDNLSEVVLTPRQLIENYDHRRKRRQSYDPSPGDRPHVTFQGKNEPVIKESDEKIGNGDVSDGQPKG